ncbi:MAG: MFS transporter [Roseiflexaceae bacterium]
MGSFAWGALAERFGNGTVPSVATLAHSANAAAWRWPLYKVQRLDLSPSFHWADPTLAITPDPEDGPLLIMVEYRVSGERASDFLEAMDEIRIFHRRESAVSRNLFRYLAASICLMVTRPNDAGCWPRLPNCLHPTQMLNLIQLGLPKTKNSARANTFPLVTSKRARKHYGVLPLPAHFVLI